MIASFMRHPVLPEHSGQENPDGQRSQSGDQVIEGRPHHQETGRENRRSLLGIVLVRLRTGLQFVFAILALSSPH